MGNNHHPFLFDVNWDFGQDDLFSQSSSDYEPIVPVSGFFLELSGDPLLLLSGQNFNLL